MSGSVRILVHRAYVDEAFRRALLSDFEGVAATQGLSVSAAERSAVIEALDASGAEPKACDSFVATFGGLIGWNLGTPFTLPSLNSVGAI